MKALFLIRVELDRSSCVELVRKDHHALQCSLGCTAHHGREDGIDHAVSFYITPLTAMVIYECQCLGVYLT